jgi:hypothetical protein
MCDVCFFYLWRKFGWGQLLDSNIIYIIDMKMSSENIDYLKQLLRDKGYSNDSFNFKTIQSIKDSLSLD